MVIPTLKEINMARVMIIGAGGVGSVVAHKCAQQSETFQEIILASRTESKCLAIAQEVYQRTQVKIKTDQVDADIVEEIVDLFKRHQPNLVIHVALPFQDLTIMDACLECGVHYVDTANYEPKETARFEYHWQWAYDEKFKKAGLVALLGSGFDPGVTNVFTSYSLKHYFDEIHYLDIIDVNGGDHGKAFATNFNPEINIREVTAKCRHWEQGAFHLSDAMSYRKSFICPEGVGEYDIYRMYHEELESLTRHIPSIKKAQFWMSFSSNYLKHLEVLQNVGMTSIDPIDFQGTQIIPLQFLKAILPNPGDLGESTQGRTCIGVIVRGTYLNEERSVYIYNICDHERCFDELGSQAVSYTTGVPAMIGAKLLLEGKWSGRGVFNMEQFDPDPFMKELDLNGLPWRVLTEGIPWT